MSSAHQSPKSCLEGTSVERWLPAIEQALPQFLRNQRWFGSKSANISHCRVIDYADWGLIWLLVELSYGGAALDHYSLVFEPVADPIAPELTVARIGVSASKLYLVDAVSTPSGSLKLLKLMTSLRPLKTRHGVVQTQTTAECDHGLINMLSAEDVNCQPRDQTNSSVRYGHSVFAKLFRRVEHGVNPDWEIGRVLTEARFPNIPSAWGCLQYDRAGEVITLAILQEQIEHQAVAWDRSVSVAVDALSRTAASFQPEPRDLETLMENGSDEQAQSVLQEYCAPVRLLGERTAQMHTALRAANGFGSEPIDQAYLAVWAGTLRDQIDQAIAALEKTRHRLPAPVAALATRVIQHREQLIGFAEGVGSFQIKAQRIRCHGDYHLGQVLVRDRDYVILDFEGEPARTIEQRRQLHSPAKDVAGMIRSFDYARRVAEATASEMGRLSGALQAWCDASTYCYLRSYLSQTRGEPFADRDQDFIRLVEYYMFEKAIYELIYELNNRPDWAGIPLTGIAGFLVKT